MIVFGCSFERVIENPVVEMAATTSEDEQQRIWDSRNILSQIGFHVLSDMWRDGHSTLLTVLCAADSTPVAIIAFAMTHTTADRDDRAVGIEIPAA